MNKALASNALAMIAMIPTRAFRTRLFRVLGAALAGVLFLASCGDSSPSPATVLMGNTRGNNVVSLNSSTGAYLGDFIAAGSGMEALGSELFVAACSAVGAPHLEQTSEPSLISATDMSQVVRLKYTE